MGGAIELDLGDVVLVVTAKVKGILPPPNFIWRIGKTSKTTDSDRVVVGTPVISKGKVGLIMDLLDDNKVAFSVQAVDDVGNPTTFEGAISFTVADPTIINLTDNGDGTGIVAATGTIGSTTLDVSATRTTDGQLFSGSAALNVVSSGTATISVAFGTPEHV